MTSYEISKEYCGDIPDWQHTLNAAFIEDVRNLLKIGGKWMFPNALAVFVKTADGWEMEDA